MTQQQLPQARREHHTLEDLLKNNKVREGFSAVATKYLDTDKALRIFINAVRKTKNLDKCDAQSVLGAMMASMALGLEPNTPKGHAHLIPYKKRVNQGGNWVDTYECQFIVGYKGYVELAYRNPSLIKLTAKAIYENDTFEHCEGSESFLRYIPALKNRGDLIGSFAYAKFTNEHGHEADVSVVLPLDEIDKIRAKSETFRSLTERASSDQKYSNGRWVKKNDKDQERDEKNLRETPWVMWEGEMAAKSAIRRLAKILPMGGDLESAATMDGLAETGQMDYGAMTDPGMAHAVIDGEVTPVREQDQDGEEHAEPPALAEPTDEPTGDPDAGEEPEPEPAKAKRGGGKKAAANTDAADDDEGGTQLFNGDE